MHNLVIDYDDFHWLRPENCLDTLKKFVEIIPDIKITLFTIPFLRNMRIIDGISFCNEVNKLVESNNIRLALHGFRHTTEEFKDLDYIWTEDHISKAWAMMNGCGKVPVTTIKVFKGPHWGINQHTYDVLEERKFTHIYVNEFWTELADANKDKRIKSVFYNWNLKDEAPDPLPETIIAHGHTHNVCGNGIDQTFDKVVDFITKNRDKLEFKFADEI